jgi:hypothetical protein
LLAIPNDKVTQPHAFYRGRPKEDSMLQDLLKKQRRQLWLSREAEWIAAILTHRQAPATQAPMTNVGDPTTISTPENLSIRPRVLEVLTTARAASGM